jgi:hypothetical protein
LPCFGGCVGVSSSCASRGEKVVVASGVQVVGQIVQKGFCGGWLESAAMNRTFRSAFLCSSDRFLSGGGSLRRFFCGAGYSWDAFPESAAGDVSLHYIMIQWNETAQRGGMSQRCAGYGAPE